MNYRKRVAVSVLVYAVAIPMVIALAFVVIKTRRYNIVSMFIALLACLPFFIGFEKGRNNARELVVIAVMIAISVVGRLIFAPLPGFKPVTAIVIITGAAFGVQAGFVTGAASALVSNIFYGQGVWTPFQMFAWGVIGLIAGLIFKRDKQPRTVPLVTVGVLGGVLFSLIMDVWTTLSYENAFNFTRYLVYVGTGLPFMAIYAISNVIFLLILANPILNKLNRAKIKYDLFPCKK